MARKTAGSAAAPSPAAKEKAGAAPKPAKAAAKPAEAPKAEIDTKTPAAPVTTEAVVKDVETPPNGVTLPVVVAAAVLAMASAEGKGPSEGDELDDEPEDGDDLPDDGAEEGAAAEVEQFSYSVPVLIEFPAVLTLTNASPGRHDVAGTNESLAPGETRDVEFTEKGFARFTKQTTQLADLHGWTEGQGILIEQGEQDAED